MSLKKFGNSASNLSGQTVARKYGKEDGSYWKFGEPSEFYILNKLFDYLPKFIVRNNLCIDILTGVAIQMAKWRVKLLSLTSYRVKGGRASLKYANEDLQLFLNNKLSDSDIVDSIKNVFTIHKHRGTGEGMYNDLKRFSGDDSVGLTYKQYNEVGWVLDVTFPDEKDFYNNCYLNLDNILDIEVRNKTGMRNSYFINVIRREFIPLIINLRALILGLRVIKWNEPDEGHQLKFGVFKFGEIVE